ncbi:DUF2232 domain-containing protein [Thiovibrio sp. JS02]
MLFQKGFSADAKKIRAIAITALVFSLPTVLPGLGWLHGLMPLPVYYFLTVYGRPQGTKIVFWAVAIAGMASLLTGTFPGLLFSLTLIPVGYILTGYAEKKESLLAAAGKGTIFLALAWLLFALLFGIMSQTNPYQEILHSLDNGFTATIALYKDSGKFGTDDMEAIAAFIDRLKVHVTRLFPALLLTSIICTVWLNIVLGQWLFRKKGTALAGGEDLKAWRLPDLFVWPVILAGFALLIPNAQLNSFGLNLGFVLLVVYLSQGLAIMATLMQQWALPKFFRFALYTFLFLEVYAIVFVAALGLADIWLDVRSRKAQQEVG